MVVVRFHNRAIFVRRRLEDWLAVSQEALARRDVMEVLSTSIIQSVRAIMSDYIPMWEAWIARSLMAAVRL